MRIPKTWVAIAAKRVIEGLVSKDIWEPTLSKEELIAEGERLILEELMIEDRVNAEVREILKKYASEIEKGRLDYRRMFEITKKKIVEERGLIL